MSEENKTVEEDEDDSTIISSSYETYKIDFDKVNDATDLIRLLKAMDLTIGTFIKGEYDDVMHLLKEAQTEK